MYKMLYDKVIEARALHLSGTFDQPETQASLSEIGPSFRLMQFVRLLQLQYLFDKGAMALKALTNLM